MKRILTLVLVFCLALSLAACGGGAAQGGTEAAAGNSGSVFKAGFGMKDITPKDSVPLDSYGDARDRMSTGLYSKLEARAVVVQDENGGMLVFATGDVSWCPAGLGNVIRADMSKELGIPESNFILSGTHTHASVATGLGDIPSVGKFNEQYIKGMEEAIRMAVADLKPTEVYVGSVMTENMNHVRRYIMDDGSLDGDNAYGTGTKRVSHETEADREMQIMKFVREGGKDIVITQFQAHPHLSGKDTNVSAQTVGAIRDALEKDMGVHSLHWQGAAGNLNTHSSLEGETPYEKSAAGMVLYGKAMAKYVASVYDSLTKVATGPVKATEYTFAGKTNQAYDNVTNEAQQVVTYFSSGHTAGETATYAHQLSAEKGLEKRINSYYHASRILSNAKLGATMNLAMQVWSFGEVAGIVNSFEMFDVTGMFVKENSPFTRTFIVGYSYPGGGGYIPTSSGFDNGGYEADNCMFAQGTAEEIADQYVSLLNDMKN